MTEASLDVSIIPPNTHKKIKYNNCESTIPPAALYVLNLGTEAKCKRMLHHEKHIDFSYIALVKEFSRNKSKWKRMEVVLPIDATEDNINNELNKTIYSFHERNGMSLITVPYPHDFVVRIKQALDYLNENYIKKLSNIDTINHITVTDYKQSKVLNPALNICWDITNKCNEHCKYCYKPIKEGEISEEDCFYIIKKVYDDGIKKITFAGGEPLLVSILPNLLKRAKEFGLITSLTTNGILWKKRKDEIINYIDWLTLPIDSLKINILSKLGRNQDHLSIVESIIKDLDYSKISLKINTVLTQINIQEIKELYRYISSKNIKRWKLSRFYPIRDKAKDNDKSFDITDDQFQDAVSELKKLNPNSQLIIECLNHSILECGYLTLLPNGFLRISNNNKDIIYGQYRFIDMAKIYRESNFDVKWQYKENRIV